MKADIITIHFGVNYGSCLQVYALSESIKKKGFECEVIDYIPKRYDSWEVYVKPKIGKYPFPLIFLWYIVTAPKREYQRYIFRKFLKKHLRLTKKYRYPRELNNDVPIADIYIAGSDQIWNYDYNSSGDFTYLLDFVGDSKKKFSYAASIGKEAFSDIEESVFISKLTGFNKITVREKSAKDLLSTIGINSEVVLDPTFLLDKSEWKKLAIPMKTQDDYILIYVMDNLYERLIDIAEKIKATKNCKIYVVTFKPTKDKRVDREFCYLRPEQFLTLVDQAMYVVTNSFHGTAFSINLNKQFLSVGKEKYNSRIKDLLDMLDLKQNFIDVNESIDEFIDIGHIDYNDVNYKIDILRRKSVEILDSYFENC